MMSGRSLRKIRVPAESPRFPAYAQEVLSKSATILVKTGHSPKELARQFARICRAIEEPSQLFDPGAVPYVSGLPHIIAHWYSEPAYLNAKGTPRALSLRGRGRNLAQLILLCHTDIHLYQ